ncbi:hypothetical protein ACWDA9_37715 [Streptomyces sp. NPDC001193]
MSLALLSTACGSGKADDKGGGATPPPSGAAAKAKTDAELAALLVTQAELPTHAVRAATPAELAAAAGADAAFASVKAAATACAGGYTGSESGDSLKISKVVPGAPVTAGDEALAYTALADVDGERASTELVVVRKGNIIATFSAVSPSGSAEQPKAVVEIQAKKLG